MHADQKDTSGRGAHGWPEYACGPVPGRRCITVAPSWPACIRLTRVHLRFRFLLPHQGRGRRCGTVPNLWRSEPERGPRVRLKQLAILRHDVSVFAAGDQVPARVSLRQTAALGGHAVDRGALRRCLLPWRRQNDGSNVSWCWATS